MHSERAIELASKTFLSAHKNCTAARHTCNPLLADQLRARATPSEFRLWEELRGRKLGAEFIHQYRLRSYIVDFYCPDALLVVEVDGPIHKFKLRTRDRKRDAILRYYGIMTLRIPNDDLNDMEPVLKRIKGVLSARLSL